MRETRQQQLPLSHASGQASRRLSQGFVWLMALACALCAANLYYSQPLLALIAHEYAVSDSLVGMIAAVSQMGYALGLLLIVPLGDSVNRRMLILMALLVVIAALAAMALAPSVVVLAAASLIMGIATVVPQIIIPFAANLACPQERGRVVGTIMSGLLIGILLARVVSGFVGVHWGWRAMFWGACGVIALLLLPLSLYLPRETQRGQIRYARLLGSLWNLLLHEPVLREVSLFGALIFACFQLFWVTATFFLSSVYHFSSDVIGLFGLAGIVGAVTASLVGRYADRGRPRVITVAMMAVILFSYGLLWISRDLLWGFLLGVILLDLGTQGGHISNQTRIYALPAEAHSRLNAVYLFTYFLGGTTGSVLGTAAWSIAGWFGVCTLGAFLMLLALVVYALRSRAATRTSV